MSGRSVRFSVEPNTPERHQVQNRGIEQERTMTFIKRIGNFARRHDKCGCGFVPLPEDGMCFDTIGEIIMEEEEHTFLKRVGSFARCHDKSTLFAPHPEDATREDMVEEEYTLFSNGVAGMVNDVGYFFASLGDFICGVSDMDGFIPCADDTSTGAELNCS